MDSVHGFTADQGQLAGVVSGVRNRWRLKRALRGATITVAVGFIVLAASAYATRALHYSDSSLWVFRLLSLAVIIASVFRFIVTPVRLTPRDAQVALYIEEHERSLDGAVITAVDVHASAAAAARSPALVARLLRSALDRMRRADDGRSVDASDLQRSSIVFAAVSAATLGIALFGPTVLRHGLGLMLVPWGDANPAGVFAIAVKPGNATIAKGGDQLVTATLRGFNADRVDLLVRSADSSEWTRVTMSGDSAGRYNYRLFDLAKVTDYSVEASGVRSPVYRLDIADLAYVKRLDLEYRYPAYTQLPTQHVDSAGDIAALKGTLVRVRVTPTRPTSGGRVIVQGGDTLQLARTADGALIAMIRVEREGFYKVELQGPDGRMVTGSLDYTIDALPDRAPSVSFVKPGRDVKVLSVDEVFTEARATDDYGVAKLELVYSVNGAAEKSVPLYSASGKISRDISAGHTFMLENEHLVAGDVVSYYAQVTDNNAVSGPQTATTDIYFLQVRPYGQDYRQQQGGGGGGGGGGQQDNPGPMSERQRQVIAASFNTARDSATLDKKSLDENVATLRLSQQKLREEVEQLGKRLVDRGITATDSGWKKIAALLPKAAAEMDSAEKLLAKGTPHGALPAEQRALVQLQRAEAVFRDIQVSMGGAGGGGGGGGGAKAQDLADIFELQKDKMRNQYEAVQRGQEQQAQEKSAAAQVDETLDKLKQLAQRQQQEDERMRRKADSLRQPGASGSSGGDGQRDLAAQTEQAARQLERLARERQSQALADAARKLQDAANSMKQAAANGKNGGADARNANDRLAEARRLLEQEKASGAQRGLSDAQKTARALADQEQQVAGDVAKLGEPGADARTPQGQQRKQALQRSLAAEKSAMADTLKDLTKRIDQLAGEQARTQPGAARALGEAADSLRSKRTEDRIRASQQQLGTASQQYLDNLERSIGEGLNDLGQRLQKAGEASSQASSGQRQQQALDRMRDLVRGMETLDDRVRQQQQGQGQQGQAGQGQGRGQGQQSAQGNGGRGGRGGRGGLGNGTVAQGGPGANRLSANDARQFSNEIQQRLRDAEALRADLAKQGADVSALDRAMEAMRAAANQDKLQDEKAGDELRTQVIDGLKAYEFALRRSIDGKDNAQILSGRNGDVPVEFRAYVEEYYRSIARPKPR